MSSSEENQNQLDNQNSNETDDDVQSLRQNLTNSESTPQVENENPIKSTLKGIKRIFTKKLPELKDQTSESENHLISSDQASSDKIKDGSSDEEGDLADFKANDQSGKIQEPFSVPVDEEIDGTDDNFYDEPKKTNPLPDLESESFVEKVTASLREDQLAATSDSEDKDLDHDETSSPLIYEHDEIVADLEAEIDKAAFAVNPFEETDEKEEITEEEESFLTQLREVFPEEDSPDKGKTKPLSETEHIFAEEQDEQSLSSKNWEEVFSATEEYDNEIQSQNLIENSQPSENQIPPFEEGWNEIPVEGTIEEDSVVDDKNITLIEDSDQPYEDEESLSGLRKSFIAELEQSPWAEEETEESTTWIAAKWLAFRNWITSLNTAEKILILMSTLISLAVIVAIILVVFQWQGNDTTPATPPEVINTTNLGDVYPTGLQLPGGWFFFLEQGEIIDNRWDPQNAEWLPGTAIRRVVAIPWSRQAEAVIQSLDTDDEVSLFFNNNDIVVYQVEEVLQVDRDNVRILSDTDPSIAVILFRNDNQDRWVIIGRP